MNGHAPHPIDGASAVLDRLRRRCETEPNRWGLLVYVGALGQWFESLRHRDNVCYEQIMQLEHEVAAGASSERLLARIAKIKGLLAALMVALVLGHLAALDRPDFRAFARRPLTRREAVLSELSPWIEA